MMLLDGKPLSEFTEDELRLWVEDLREKREALRNEAIKKHKEEEESKKVGRVSTPREPRAKAQGKKVDDFTKSMLDFLKGDD